MMARAGRAIRGARLFLLSFLALLFFRVAVPVAGFRRLTWLFRSNAEAPPARFAQRVAASVQSSSWLVGGASCLVQACAVRAIIGLKGYGVTMRVGVRESGSGTIAAHAWLMSGDQVIIGDQAEHFQRYRKIVDYK